MAKKPDKEEEDNKETKPELPPAEERKNVKRGKDPVTDDGDEDALPSSKKSVGGGSPGGWSHEEIAAKTNKGGASGAAREADRDRERRQNMRESWEFRKKYGMSRSEYDTLQRMKKEIAARKAKFVAGAKAGKFSGNIYLSGDNWEALAAQVDEQGNLSETVDLSDKGRNAQAMKDLNEWAKALNANDGSRYGGKYNMTALPKGIFIRDADGEWKVNEAMITSQAQVNALLQMKAQDDARQGKWKSEEKQRVVKKALEDRAFLEKNGAYTKEALDEMNADQLSAEVAAMRQENIEQGVKEGDEQRVKEYGGSASQQNKAAGRPDTQAEFDKAADWENPIDFDKMLSQDEVPPAQPKGDQGPQPGPWEPSPSSAIEPEPGDIKPAQPKDQSPKTSVSPKIDEEDK